MRTLKMIFTERHSYWAVPLLALLMAGCAGKKGAEPQPTFSDLAPAVRAPVKPVFQQVTNHEDSVPARADNSLFTLGPGDRIEVEMIGRPNSRAETFVGPDGKIYYSLLPGQDVWGLTLGQTRDVLQRELSKYMTTPEVAVTLRGVSSRHVWLLGRLNVPGIYPLGGPTTLLEAIATAGGTARSTSQVTTEELADLRHSFVMRDGRNLSVDFYKLLHDGDTSQNLYLQPNDFVFFPSTLSSEVYVLGAVKSPRAIPYREEMTLSSAIAGADGPVFYELLTPSTGGRVTDAYLSHVAIVRGTLAKPDVAVVDYHAILKCSAPDVRLEPGDIVYVPNSPYGTLKSYINMVINTFVTTIAANEGARAGGSTNTLGVVVNVGQTGTGSGVPTGGH